MPAFFIVSYLEAIISSGEILCAISHIPGIPMAASQSSSQM